MRLDEIITTVRDTVPIRRRAVSTILNAEPAKPSPSPGSASPAIAGDSAGSAHALDTADRLRRLTAQLHAASAATPIDLRYEISELERDIVFLRDGEEALRKELARTVPAFTEERTRVAELLSGIPSRPPDTSTRRAIDLVWITDRDGTVNNYCARYLTSVQSIYNAVWMTRFARRITGPSVVLTSAPLSGLGEVATAPTTDFIVAGSKGREYRAHGGRLETAPISDEAVAALDRLNRRIVALVERPENRVFALTGSGVQQKFGQTAVCRQDVSGSIPEAESRRFAEAVRALVAELDPAGSWFAVEDTGLDLEIALKDGGVNDSAGTRDEGEQPTGGYDKADGLAFLDRHVPLSLGTRRVLVCGDTFSDLPMLEYALHHAGETWAVFVTTDEALRHRVRTLLPHALCVSTPDALLAGLHDRAR